MADLFSSWFGRSRRSEQIRENNRYFQRFSSDVRLRDCGYVVFDTELTGLDRKNDEIIAIGAVRVRDLRIDLSETFHYYIRPRSLDHTDATLIHRITPQQLQAAPTLDEVLPQFLRFIGTDLLVGHYVWIDTSFLDRATRALYRGTVANPSLDTMKMARIYRRLVLGDLSGAPPENDSGVNLQQLSGEFNLPFFEAHDALEDALQTAYLFLFLIKKLEAAGVATLSELYRAGRQASWGPARPDGT